MSAVAKSLSQLTMLDLVRRFDFQLELGRVRAAEYQPDDFKDTAQLVLHSLHRQHQEGVSWAIRSPDVLFTLLQCQF